MEYTVQRLIAKLCNPGCQFANLIDELAPLHPPNIRMQYVQTANVLPMWPPVMSNSNANACIIVCNLHFKGVGEVNFL